MELDALPYQIRSDPLKVYSEKSGEFDYRRMTNNWVKIYGPVY